MIASLPMYDWPEIQFETDLFWETLEISFSDHGLSPPKKLQRFADESCAWGAEDLFFSQTCGYPFSKFPLGQANLLGTPHFNVEGWQGPRYSSAIIVRKDSNWVDLRQTRRARFAYNGAESLSGFRCLSPALGNPKNWFREATRSGSHRESSAMVATGLCDICAVDAYCWYLLNLVDPTVASQLKVLSWTGLLPALPYITSGTVTGDNLRVRRKALQEGIEAAAGMSKLARLKLIGSSVLEADAYEKLGVF